MIKRREYLMNSCRTIPTEKLENTLNVRVDEKNLDFRKAKALADEKAREVAFDPMLLAWYEKSTGRYSPDVECCGEDKPSWIIYAESRGARVTVSVNDTDYLFLYRDALENDSDEIS